jgi:hypothetical protein
MPGFCSLIWCILEKVANRPPVFTAHCTQSLYPRANGLPDLCQGDVARDMSSQHREINLTHVQ